MPVLVDTNVIVDVVTDDADWADWSIAQLAEHEHRGLLINPVVYAELCFGFPTYEAVDRLVNHFRLVYEEIPRAGLFRASKAFAAYKRRGGVKHSILPDFFVGGHAAATGLPVLTRDARRFRTYFPSVELVCPETSS